MSTSFVKKDFPVEEIRSFLEPGPTVLVSSIWQNKTNIMTMNWHTVLEFSPSLIGCMITSANHSHEMIKKSKECVINIPTIDLVQKVISIGNSHGTRIEKFKKFQLTAVEAEKVKAPMIKECYANFECKVVDMQLVRKYNFFIMEVVKAHVAIKPKYPTTIHYRGHATFMVSGKNISFPKKFKRQNL